MPSARASSTSRCEHHLADASAERSRVGAHRLDLAMTGLERLQCAHPEQPVVGIAKREEADFRTTEPIDRQDMARLGRGIGPHFGEVMIKQLANVRPVELAFRKIAHSL